LERLGFRNAKIVTGDGSLGMPEAAPYDAIIVSAAAPRIPQALIDQLAVGGRLLIPVGESEQQVLQLVQRNADGSTSVRTLEGCRFVPLIGEQGFVA
jgi:protein-L-isoaspartate(D-aspartate) O-methyltransferase